MALDVETGALRWYHQVHPHDLFDRDLVHTLIARPPDGARRRGGDRQGRASSSASTPTSGELRWSTPVGHHENDDLTALTGPTLVAPGTFGGVITPPATADGVVYAAVIDAPVTLEPAATAYFGAQPGQFDGQVVAIDATDRRHPLGDRRARRPLRRRRRSSTTWCSPRPSRARSSPSTGRPVSWCGGRRHRAASTAG